MLKILDKYIIRKFLSTFFFMLGIIMLLSMVFDMSERLGEFIEKQAPISDIFFKYYFTFILYYGNTFSSMIIFISVIWFTAKMATDSEIIPIMNSGKPFNRFLRPYMIAATILMLISLIMNHLILPRANRVRLDFDNEYYRVGLHVEDYYAEFPGNISVNFASYISEENVINDFNLQKTNQKDEVIYFVKARTATNIIGTKKWVLKDYYERKVLGVNEEIINGKEKDTVFNFTIDDMAHRENIAEIMNFTELREFIKHEKERGAENIPTYELELYRRSSLPFATYILTIIGVSVSSRKKRGGVGINIAMGLGIIFIYIFTMKIMDVSAVNVGFSPMFAVWIPNVIFGIIAYILYKYAPK
ncbi:MAG: LptF/LptG family permease [Flavobacteriia bacterium]|nr:LptF/LptG family permease [Flavobacteriia bacterium]